ncbi:MAG TPA: hypothetical protein VJ787_08530 [Thermoleophilia bacterium]|nr:hypothetical protein [Thermoleophilia bacterium]
MKRLIAIIAVAAVAGTGVALWLSLTSSDSGAGGIPVTPSPGSQFDVRGIVSGVSADPSGVGGSFLVKGTPLGVSGVDYASVRVTADTGIYLRSGNTLTSVGFSALRDGQTVEVDLVGPVAESYPVQGAAGTIVILG